MCSSRTSFARASSSRRLSRSGSFASAGRTIRYGMSSPLTDTVSSDSSCGELLGVIARQLAEVPLAGERHSSRTRAPPFTASPIDLTWSSSVRFVWRS